MKILGYPDVVSQSQLELVFGVENILLLIHGFSCVHISEASSMNDETHTANPVAFDSLLLESSSSCCLNNNCVFPVLQEL